MNENDGIEDYSARIRRGPSAAPAAPVVPVTPARDNDGIEDYSARIRRPAPAAARAAPAAAAQGGVDWEEVHKGFVGGLQRGTTGLVGLLGDAKMAMDAGGEWIGNKLGLPPLPEDVKRANAAAAFSPPTTEDVRGAVIPHTGAFYEPKTRAGKYASTFGEFAPAAVAPSSALRTIPRAIGAKIANTAIPAVASETAGQLTKDTSYEPLARGVAGIVSGVRPPLSELARAGVAAGGAWLGHAAGGVPGAAIGGAVPYFTRGRHGANLALPPGSRDALAQTLLQQKLARPSGPDQQTFYEWIGGPMLEAGSYALRTLEGER
jgi:hypothetical protein